jgi:tetratricopeptide (TPR) repeat protein
MRETTVSAYSRWLYASFYLEPLGRYHEAVAEMRHAVEQDPLNVTWRTNSGLALSAVGRYDEALGQLRRALEIDPRNWGAHFIVGQTCMAMGDFPAAVAGTEEAYAASPPALAPLGTARRRACACGRHGSRSDPHPPTRRLANPALRKGPLSPLWLGDRCSCGVVGEDDRAARAVCR